MKVKDNVIKLFIGLICFFVIISVPQKIFATTKTREEAIEWVKSQVGKSIDADGQYGAQCVDLILAYYDFLGVPRSSGNGIDYTENALPSGWSRIPGAVPQMGDILVYANGYGHVAIFESTYSTYHQNFNYNPRVERVTIAYNALNTNPYWGVIRPNFATKPNGNDPQGFLDSVNGGKGYVDVNGWTFDKDAPSQSINVHVYIGGPAGSGAPLYRISANKERLDVNKTYNITGNHGFSNRIYTNMTGNQTVYIYAINVGSGQNVEIGHKTVNIQKADPPVISDVQILEQDSQGYVIQCKAFSEVGIDRVQCPTWTINNGQDDIAANWPTNTAVSAYQSGDYYRFRVNISDHNREYGRYTTHIYAYDLCGNEVLYRVDVLVTNGIMPQRIVRDTTSGDYLLSVYDENLNWTQMNEFAEKTGGALADIYHENKQNVIYDLIKDRFRTYYSAGAYTTGKDVQWKWLDGYKIGSYTNWNEGAPSYSGNNEYYLALLSSTGKWDNISANSTNNGFITQTPLNLKADAIFEWNGKTYRFYNVAMPYNLAKRFCEENGGNLVVINSKEENDFLASKTQELNHTYYIGATDEESEGDFKWVTGEPMTYQNWASGEPNNDVGSGGEHYASIRPSGEWNDTIGQSDAIGFIAECTKPVISNFKVSNITDTECTIDVDVASDQENLRVYLISNSFCDFIEEWYSEYYEMQELSQGHYQIVFEAGNCFENYRFCIGTCMKEGGVKYSAKEEWLYNLYEAQETAFIPNKRIIEMKVGESIPTSTFAESWDHFRWYYNTDILSLDEETGMLSATQAGRTPIVLFSIKHQLYTAWTVVVKPEDQQGQYMYGDVDGDTNITAKDALSILRFAAKLETLDDRQVVVADVDGDTNVTATDALYVLKHAAKIISSFPVEESEEGTTPEPETKYTEIYTADDLNGIKNNLDGNYILMRDIDLTSVPCIGNENQPFTGVFDGNGYTINYLNVSSTIQNAQDSDIYVGLFSYAQSAEFKNITTAGQIIHQSDCTSTNITYVGVICGYSKNTSFTNCRNNADVSTAVEKVNSGIDVITYTGGICGCSTDGSVIDCANNGNIKINIDVDGSAAAHGGGIVGGGFAASIKNCVNNGDIQSETFSLLNFISGDLLPFVHASSGGIAGRTSNTKINDCSNYAQINASCPVETVGASNIVAAGGIVGEGRDCFCENVYNEGTVEAQGDTRFVSIFKNSIIGWKC